MENDENKPINLRQYKAHFRKFPWTLIIRIGAILAAIGIIFYLMQFLIDLKKEKMKTKDGIELEMERPDSD